MKKMILCQSDPFGREFEVDLKTADPMFLPNEPIFLSRLSRSRRLIPAMAAAATAGQSQSNRCCWPILPKKYIQIH